MCYVGIDHDDFYLLKVIFMRFYFAQLSVTQHSDKKIAGQDLGCLGPPTVHYCEAPISGVWAGP